MAQLLVRRVLRVMTQVKTLKKATRRRLLETVTPPIGEDSLDNILGALIEEGLVKKAPGERSGKGGHPPYEYHWQGD